MAIRAGHLASDEIYPTKIFLSAKVRELTPQGEQKLEDFMLLNYMALLAELARELGDESIAKIDPAQRANETRRLLSDRHALIIIDNLETFDEQERRRVFQFLKRLPRSCKAIVTSRRRTDVAAEIIRLDRLRKDDALELIAKLAERNGHLARTSEAERLELYEFTKGNPLLMEWVAGQLGRSGSQCHTIADACRFLESAPAGNDPLEFIFGDVGALYTACQSGVDCRCGRSSADRSRNRAGGFKRPRPDRRGCAGANFPAAAADSDVPPPQAARRDHASGQPPA